MSDKIEVIVDSDLEDLIPGFLENRMQDLEKLQQAAKRGDFGTLQSIGHSLKGVGGGYGFDRMSKIGEGIENAGRTSDLEAANGRVAELADYLSRLNIVFE